LLEIEKDDEDGVEELKIQEENCESTVDNFLTQMTNNISLTSITRPFITTLNRLQFQPGKSLYSLEDKKEPLLILTIKVQVYIGSQALSKPKLIKWTGLTADQNPLFNKKLFFDLKYYNLPLFSSLLFQIRLIKLGRKGEIESQDIKAWGNFRLFDHNRRLKTGN
jgi:hypothetical protein